MSGQGIQTDVAFFLKPQATVSQIKSLDDVNFVMKLMPHILRLKEEQPKLMSVCNQVEKIAREGTSSEKSVNPHPLRIDVVKFDGKNNFGM